MSKVLVVDDNARIVSILATCLAADGYEVQTAGDGVTALSMVMSDKPDVALVDVMLPDIGGLELTRVFHEQHVPTIIVSARVAEDDRLAGLEAGADDYITKPFSTREVLARVRVVLRHAERARQAVAGGLKIESIVAGPFTIDLVRRTASYRGTAIKLTRTEFELLSVLAGSPGRVFSREELSAVLHGAPDSRGGRAIDSHMKNLRRAIGSPGKDAVVSVYGVGYKLDV
jgi:DNA-binding response OmpR family regulator